MKRAVVCVAIWMAGCAVGPNYRRPPVNAPAGFRGAAPAQTADPVSIGDVKWFEIFKDEQLQQLVRAALERNYDLREAAARVEAARAILGVTRADLFPTVAASANVTLSRLSSRGSFPLPAGAPVERRFGTVALNLLSYELDLWGRLRRATEAARAGLIASEENRRTVITTLISDVASAYFNLIALDLELEIAQRTLASRRDSLKLIRVRAEGGIGTELDVRQGEQLVFGAEQTIPAIERDIEQTENLISLLLGNNPQPISRGRALIDQEQPPALPPGLPASLLERRPDIRAAEQNLVAANANIGVARAAYFPQISLTGALGGQSTQLSNLYAGPARIWQFVPQITQPLFTGGRIRSSVRLAQAEREATLAAYQRAIQTAFREVSDALIEHRKAREIRGKQELLVSALQNRSRLAYMRYRGGVDTLLNPLDADRDLFAAEILLVQGRLNELLAIVQLYRALGGGWQE